MPSRNLPTDAPAALADLITCRSGQVSSMALCTVSSACDMMLLALSGGESISEETYSGDTVYFAVEGKMYVVLPERHILLEPGQVFCVPANTPHAVEGDAADYKVLQVNFA